MSDMRQALELVAANADKASFAGPRSSELIAAAEKALGGQFPPTFREFVSVLGAGDFAGFEIYGIVDEDFEHSSVPNGVWLTLLERRLSGLPQNYFIVASAGDGAYYCLEMRDSGESPVYVYIPELPARSRTWEPVAEDFGEFVLSHFKR